MTVILGTLITARTRLPLTDEDRLRLAQLMAQEDGEHGSYAAGHAIGSTIIRRWAVLADERLARDLPLYWPDLRTLIADYAQWPPPPGRPRAQRLYATPWGELPPQFQRAADDLVTGRTALSAAPAVHWGAESLLTPEGRSRHEGNEIVPSASHNVLFSTPASRAAREPRITSASSRLTAALAFAAGAAAGFGTFYVVQRL